MRLIDADKLDYCLLSYESIEFIKEYIYNEPTVNTWIPVSERLPEEHDSIFAKLNKTKSRPNGMYLKRSDLVNVTIEYVDGTRKTDSSFTRDGKWAIENQHKISEFKVIAWQPLPKKYTGD